MKQTEATEFLDEFSDFPTGEERPSRDERIVVHNDSDNQSQADSKTKVKAVVQMLKFAYILNLCVCVSLCRLVALSLSLSCLFSIACSFLVFQNIFGWLCTLQVTLPFCNFDGLYAF